MPKRTHHPGSGYRAAPPLIAAVALALLLTACSDADGIETSVPRTGTPSGTATTEPSSDPISQAAVEREVTDRYVTFQRIVAETGATSDADDPRLAEYATGAVLGNLRGKDMSRGGLWPCRRTSVADAGHTSEGDGCNSVPST